MNVIGLAGRAGSGKDTVAEFIIERLEGWQRIAFADPLRRIAADLYGLTPKQMTDRHFKEQWLPQWGLSPREILQRLGTEVARSISPDTWTRSALRTMSKSEAPGFVITDVRFCNEVDLVRTLGGFVWWIDRNTPAVAAHESERALAPGNCDAVISNNGTVDELRQAVHAELSLHSPSEFQRFAD